MKLAFKKNISATNTVAKNCVCKCSSNYYAAANGMKKIH